MNIFAVVCHGNAKGLLEVTKEFGAKCSCLYNDPVDPSTFRNAPFLVEINEGIKPWLAELTEPWGIYLITEKNITFNEIRQHLRKFTYVQIPSQSAPVMFRFYDPRVFWGFTEIIDDWNLHRFLGPVSLVASNYNEFKQAHFSERREGYPKGNYGKGGYLVFTEAQEAEFNRLSENDYIEKLSDYLWNYFDRSILEKIGLERVTEEVHIEMLLHQRDVKGVEITHPEDLKLLAQAPTLKQKEKESIEGYKTKIHQLAFSFYYFCFRNGIRKDRYIKSLGFLLMIRKLYEFESIPQEWLMKLSDRLKEPEIRAENLLYQELGFVPRGVMHG